MGVIQQVERAINNPLPEGRVDDILRPEGENPLLERGYVTTSKATPMPLATIRNSRVGRYSASTCVLSLLLG